MRQWYVAQRRGGAEADATRDGGGVAARLWRYGVEARLTDEARRDETDETGREEARRDTARRGETRRDEARLGRM